MKKVLFLLTMLLCWTTGAWADYTVNYTGAHTHTGRVVSAVKVTPTGGTEQSVAVNGNQTYNDLSAQSVTVEPGATLKVALTGMGSWMNAAVLVDEDQNGSFEYTTGTLAEHTFSGELKSFSFFCFDGANDENGYNSAGTNIKGNARSTTDLPTFTAPTQTGDYRMRVLYAWNSVDPAGYADIYSHGGYIIDVTLKVAAASNEPDPVLVNGLWTMPSLVEGAFGSKTVWYTLANQQTNQTGYISTSYTNGAFLATTNTTKDTSDNGLWCIVGDATTGFKFFNKGEGPSKVLSNNANDASGMVSAETTANTLFTFSERTAGGGVWNIINGTSGNNYWCGSNNKLGHWNSTSAANDNNCRWIFEAVGETPNPGPEPEPTNYFSSSVADASYWGIKFNAGTAYLNDEGANTLTITSGSCKTLWALIGTETSFKLYSNKGNYVGVKNATATNGQTDNLCYATTEANAVTFTLVNKSGNTFEIARTSNASKTFNPWGGMGSGKSIGFWNAGDNNNKLVFVDAEDMAEYAIEGLTSFEKPSKHTLWYNEPAPLDYDGWQEYSLPIGNGEFGGSVFGGVKNDKITFNEKSLWDGNSVTRNNGPHGEYLKFGQINVANLNEGCKAGVSNYARYLDIDNAVAGVQYTDAAGTNYKSTFISSQPDKVMVVRYTAEGDNTLKLKFSVVPGGQMVSCSTTKPVVSYADGSATFHGKLELLSYAAQFTVKSVDGTITSDATGVTVSDATEVLLYVTGGTDFDAFKQDAGFVNGTAAQLPSIMAERINAAHARGWQTIYDDHVADFRSFMDRAAIELKKDGQKVNSDLNTKNLIDSYGANKNGFKDSSEGLFLEQLYYNYGRYLLISSNRYAPVPNNLQGLWVDTDSGHAPWNSDIHTNINIQMNYWPAEQNNLSDLHMPLLDHIVSISNSPGCLNQAKTAGQTVGWVVNTESNLFGGMSNWSSNYTIANAWYVTHLWQHYAFTLDKEYLKKVFPTMWSAAQYWAERMKLASDGTYECPNEFSPEHGPQSQNATAHSQQLVNELFSNTLAAIEALGNESELDATWLAKIRDRYSKSDSGLHIETYSSSAGWGEDFISYGSPILREWKYSAFNAGAKYHRHTSHLMALYPFSQIQPGDENFQGAVNSLAQRSDNSTGWAMGWRVNLWARAQDGNHARRMINNALVHAGGGVNYSGNGCVYYNLWDAHTPFQIDGNFGVCAGISEMLIQSGTGVISLLPALPDAWAEGSFRGLKAVGNFTVDAAWAEGKLTTAVIRNNKGSELKVKYAGLADAIIYNQRGEQLTATPVAGAANTYVIASAEGDVITITKAVADHQDAFVRLEKNGGYLAAQADGTTTLAEEEAPATVFYNDNGKLLSYKTGLYAGVTETGYAVNALESLPVEIGATGYNTFCAPVAVNVPAGLRAFVGRVEGSVIKLFNVVNDSEEKPVIPAHTGVLLYAPAGAASFELPMTTFGESYEDNAFYGTFNTIALPEGFNWYALQRNKTTDEVGFMSKTTGTLAGFHAFVREEATLPVHAFTFELADVTDIHGLELVERLNAPVYDLQGRKIKNSTRGLYIANGKKVLR